MATPFITSAIGKNTLLPTAAVSPAAVGNDADSLVSEMISTDIVVKVGFITSDDEDSTQHLGSIVRYSMT